MTAATLREKLLPAIAVHEAGHVVAGLHHDMPFEYVTLTRTPGKSEAHVRPIQSSNPGGYHCHHIMPTYAGGAIAQDIATGCRDRIVATAGSRGDFVEVRECARLVRDAQRRGENTEMDLPPNATVRKIAEVAWQETYRLIVAEWGAVQAVADALLHSTAALTQTDCERIIAGAGTVTPPAHAHQAEAFWPAWFMPRWWVPEKRVRKAPVATGSMASGPAVGPSPTEAAR